VGRAGSAFIEAAAVRALASYNGYSGGLIGGACGRPIRITRLPVVLLTLVAPHNVGLAPVTVSFEISVH
jgi:hypothetical protein